MLSTFLECSQMSGVFYHCNTRLRLLHLLYDIEVMWRKTIKHAFSMFYDKTGFLTNQSAHRVLSVLKRHPVIHFLKAGVIKDRNDILIDLWFGIPWFFNTIPSAYQAKIFQEFTITFSDVPRISVQKFWGLRLLVERKAASLLTSFLYFYCLHACIV